MAVETSNDEGAGAVAASADERLMGILESVLFASGEPIALKRLVEIVGGAPAEIRAALEALGERLASSARGLRLAEVAGGYQLRTARENAEWVRAAFRDRPRKLGRAALETLAVIAYRQPVTRAEIEAVRGVDIEAVLSTLLQRNLVQALGRKETVGRPLLYGTTTAFLELFGFRDLAELPVLKELPEGAADAATEEESSNGADAAAAHAAESTRERGPQEAADEAEPAAAADGAPTEAPESGGRDLETQGRGADPRGPGAGERPGGQGARDEGGCDERQD